MKRSDIENKPDYLMNQARCTAALKNLIEFMKAHPNLHEECKEYSDLAQLGLIFFSVNEVGAHMMGKQGIKNDDLRKEQKKAEKAAQDAFNYLRSLPRLKDSPIPTMEDMQRIFGLFMENLWEQRKSNKPFTQLEVWLIDYIESIYETQQAYLGEL